MKYLYMFPLCSLLVTHNCQIIIGETSKQKHTHAYKNTYINTYPQEQGYTCTQTHAYTKTHVLAYACTCMYIYVNAYMYMYIHTYPCTCILLYLKKNKGKNTIYIFFLNKYINFTLNIINTIKHIQTIGKEDLRSKKTYK